MLKMSDSECVELTSDSEVLMKVVMTHDHTHQDRTVYILLRVANRVFAFHVSSRPQNQINLSTDNMQDLSAEEASRQPYEEVAARLQTDVHRGLSWSEAELRLKIYGANEFEAKVDDPLWKKYLEQVCDECGCSA